MRRRSALRAERTRTPGGPGPRRRALEARRRARRTSRTGVPVVLVGLLAALLPIPHGGDAAVAAAAEVRIEGSGWGHGRGMSQWGAYGYAVDRGWSHQQILDHFYRGTRLAADAGNPTVRVHLTGRGSRDLVATAPSLRVAGQVPPGAAVRVRRVGSGTFAVDTGPGCGGPWQPWQGSVRGEVAVQSAGSAADPLQRVQLCESATDRRAYRGSLVAVDAGGSAATVNDVRLDDYLLGVVPREMPASWGSRPNGAAALRAQAVAARSYALSSRWRAWADTCDSTSCQVYQGSAQVRGNRLTTLEDSRTTAAVQATSGQVRRRGDGRISRTEFSASSGGRTAGGEFPSVDDLGDATASNPHRSWSVAMTGTEMGRRLGTGAVREVRVTGRGSAASNGERVTEVVVDTTSGSRRYSGSAFRSALGLKSTRFRVVETAPTAQTLAVVQALYADTLGRPADSSGLASWGAYAQRHGAAAAVSGLRRSAESSRRELDGVYRTALGRPLGAGEGGSHVTALRRGAPRTHVEATVYSSREALGRLAVLGSGSWVDGVYRQVLGRPADSGGLAHWRQVARTQGHRAAALGILSSDEAAQRRLAEIYGDMLGRAVDPVGRRGWVPHLRAGREEYVVGRIASSREYYSRAASRYGV